MESPGSLMEAFPLYLVLVDTLFLSHNVKFSGASIWAFQWGSSIQYVGLWLLQSRFMSSFIWILLWFLNAFTCSLVDLLWVIHRTSMQNTAQ